MFAVKLKVGDEVGFGRFGRFNFHSAGFGRVVKINGYGHITLDSGKVFDKHGDERGTTYGLRLTDAASLRESQARDVAAKSQVARVKELEAKIKDMFGYSGNVHVTPESKAELMALVEAL